VKVHNLKDEDYSYQYIIALNWSLSQFTPGTSTISAVTHFERIYVASVLVLAMVVATCFVSSITSALGQMWSMNRYAATQAFLLKKFLHQNHVPRSLEQRVTRYVEGVVELRYAKVHPTKVEYLKLLSGPLNIELQREMRLPQLVVNPMLKQYSVVNIDVLGKLCATSISSAYFGKNDVIFKEGATAEAMYFVNVGMLAYGYVFSKHCHPDNATLMVQKLEAHQWCSEAALWIPWNHRGEMKAVAHSDVVTLNARLFVELTASSEDVYKFACGQAYLFWNNYDAEADTDVLDFSFAPDSAAGDLLLSSDELRLAEDADVDLMNFD